MNKLKKIAAFLLACVCLTVCVVPVMNVDAASTYAFRSKGVSVAPGKSASDFIKANKDYYVSIKNSRSCVASSGYDVTREYKYFTLVTYSTKKNGEGKVESITITDSDVTTVEGAHCGMDVEKLKKIYKKAKKLGSTYYVKKGKTKIVFLVEDDEVAEINYLYTGSF